MNYMTAMLISAIVIVGYTAAGGFLLPLPPTLFRALL